MLPFFSRFVARADDDRRSPTGPMQPHKEKASFVHPMLRVHLMDVPHLSDWLTMPHMYKNPFTVDARARLYEPTEPNRRDIEIVSKDPPELVLLDIVHCSEKSPIGTTTTTTTTTATATPPCSASTGAEPLGDNKAILEGEVRDIRAFRRAGAYEELAWEPKEVRAAIITCGGLSPGINNVIHGLVRTLYHNYGVTKIFGVPFGYQGIYSNDYIKLKPNIVTTQQACGGSFLGCTRGGFDTTKIMDALVSRGINQVYVIGGDGTHRGAAKLHAEAVRRKLKMAVIGIPKTVDNDIGLIDRSFGFETCVGEASRVVECADVEASSAYNGVVVVRLMGRDSGFIAAHTTLASRRVNLCLIPEIPFEMSGPKSILTHLRSTVEHEGSAVVVVAEGAGQDKLADLSIEEDDHDASGNKRYREFGPWLCAQIKKDFQAHNLPVNVKYIDPSYTIRSVAADAHDAEYCMLLASSAVHGAMAGFCGFSAGLVNNRTCFIPMTMIGETSPRRLARGRRWARVIDSTRQPD